MQPDLANYHDSLIGIAYRITGDVESAKDVVQDSYVAALKPDNAFGGFSSLKTYLYRIVINKSIDAKRNWKRRLSMLFSLKAELSGTESNFLDDLDRKELVRRLLSKVPDNFRIPLILAEVGRDVICRNRRNIAYFTQYRSYENIQGPGNASKGIKENKGSAMKNCKYYRKLISRSIDDDLIDAEKRLLIGHLSSCGECMEVLDAYSVLRQDRGENLANGSLCHEAKEPLRSDTSSTLGSIISKARPA